MEPITHFLTGAALGRSGFNRKSALATAVMCVAAEAGDIDVVAYFGGPVTGFAQHRGITHTLIGVPFVAALVLGVVWAVRALWHLWRPHLPRPNELPVRWGYLYFCAILAALSHILLDFTNNYGVRPLYPFNGRWYAWDIVFIIEPVMLVLLIGGLTLPWLFGLVNSEIGAREHGPRGRGAAIAALVGVVLMWGVRDYQHRRAEAALESFLYNGQQATRVAAFPAPVNPFKWYGVVETNSFYQSMKVDSLHTQVDPQERAITYYKPEETEAMKAARATRLGQVYYDWARFPLMEQQSMPEPHGGTEVILRDVRFMSLERRDVLAGYVVLDRSQRVVSESFRPPEGR